MSDVASLGPPFDLRVAGALLSIVGIHFRSAGEDFGDGLWVLASSSTGSTTRFKDEDEDRGN
eukprot:9007624-Karenia_brevis.AAC.1